MDRLYDESGATIILVAVVMTVLMVFTALTVDIGYTYVCASQSQNCADACALSVQKLLPVKCDDIEKKRTIINVAKEYARKNGTDSLKDNDVNFEDDKSGYYYSVSIFVEKICKTHFSRVIGVNDISVKKKAKVSALPAGGVMGAVPIGVTEEVFNETKDNPSSVTLKFGGGDGTNGYYGYVVLDGAKGNANILEKWLKYGYPGVNYVGQELPTATGNKASVAKDGVAYRMHLCTHYKNCGGCTPQHYVENCPRIINVLVYNIIDRDTVKIAGFAPFILEYSDEFDEICGTYLKIPVNQSDGSIGDKDFGGYVGKLTQ